MSGFVERMCAAIRARVNGAVDLIEDPRLSLDYSLAKLEEDRVALSRSLVEVSAARQRLLEQREKLFGQVRKHEEQATASLRASRDDLARAALERKAEAQERLKEMEGSLGSLESQVQDLKLSQAGLDRKIAFFRSKKEELKSLYDSSRAQMRLREAVSGISQDLADVGSTIQRIENTIQVLRARTAAIDGLIAEGVLSDALEAGSDDIDRELAQIRREEAVEEELARLKAEAGLQVEG